MEKYVKATCIIFEPIVILILNLLKDNVRQ